MKEELIHSKEIGDRIYESYRYRFTDDERACIIRVLQHWRPTWRNEMPKEDAARLKDECIQTFIDALEQVCDGFLNHCALRPTAKKRQQELDETLSTFRAAISRCESILALDVYHSHVESLEEVPLPGTALTELCHQALIKRARGRVVIQEAAAAKEHLDRIVGLLEQEAIKVRKGRPSIDKDSKLVEQIAPVCQLYLGLEPTTYTGADLVRGHNRGGGLVSEIIKVVLAILTNHPATDARRHIVRAQKNLKK